MDLFQNSNLILMQKSVPNTQKSKPQKLKRSLWYHLHFWIGWIAAIPIALVCLTGALLAFYSQIVHWENPELFNLEPTGPRPSVQHVLETFESAEPAYSVRHLGIPEDPRHAYKAYAVQHLPEGNRNVQVYYNPYNDQLTPVTGKFSLANAIVKVHRSLLASKAGVMIVAVSSVLLAITAIFGLILWLPMKSRTFVRAWKRGQAIDWHNALGVVSLLPLIVMAVTGVTFTWGKQVFPLLEKVQGGPSRLPTPVVSAPDDAVKLPFQDALDRVETALPDIRVSGVQPSNTNKNPHTIIMDDNGSIVRVFVDPFTGEELLRMDGKGTGPVGWYRERFGKFHTFSTYGTFWRLLWGLFSLAGTLLAVTGLWISIKRWRRPKRAAI